MKFHVKFIVLLFCVLFSSIIFAQNTDTKTISIDSLINEVELKWYYLESTYQRRADLIPNLVATVNKATNYEKETLTAVVEARAKATSIQIDPSNLTPEKLAEFQQAQSGLGSSLSRLLVSIERYPDLKANQSILAFQNQLEGTENRIKVERDNYNESVLNYKAYVSQLPENIIKNKAIRKIGLLSSQY